MVCGLTVQEKVVEQLFAPADAQSGPSPSPPPPPPPPPSPSPSPSPPPPVSGSPSPSPPFSPSPAPPSSTPPPSPGQGQATTFDEIGGDGQGVPPLLPLDRAADGDVGRLPPGALAAAPPAPGVFGGPTGGSSDSPSVNNFDYQRGIKLCSI